MRIVKLSKEALGVYTLAGCKAFFETVLPCENNEFDIVGEASYQKALSKICGGKKEDSAKQYVEAELYLENDNPHDNKAVCVTIKGQTVGYLSRNDARAFRKQVKELENKKPTFLCKALIVGGWSRSKSDKGNFGVKLDLPVA